MFFLKNVNSNKISLFCVCVNKVIFCLSFITYLFVLEMESIALKAQFDDLCAHIRDMNDEICVMEHDLSSRKTRMIDLDKLIEQYNTERKMKQEKIDMLVRERLEMETNLENLRTKAEEQQKENDEKKNALLAQFKKVHLLNTLYVCIVCLFFLE